MSFNTILVHADQSSAAPARIEIAARIAHAAGAHLIGAAMTGVSRFIYHDGSVDLVRSIAALHVDALYHKARCALGQFDAVIAGSGVTSYETRLIDDDTASGLALHAHYADLVVIGQPDPATAATRVWQGLPGYVLLNSPRPVLVVPHAGHPARVGNSILVAWDESIEASRALAGALPLLQGAASVTVAMFNPAPDSPPDTDAELGRYLARHGVAAEIVRRNSDDAIGLALLSMAAELRADLVVAGAFGHARLREVVLGGVTRTLLRSMTVPILMAH